MINSNMWLDGDVINQPSMYGSRKNYNINNYIDLGSVTNEKSNIEYSSGYSKTFLNAFSIDSDIIVFSLENEIGIIQEGKYKKLLVDSSLNFNLDSEITGAYYVNSNNEKVILFAYNNGTKHYNITLNVLEDLQNKAKEPNIELFKVESGNLQVGGYIVAIRFIKNDDSRTSVYKGYGSFIIEDNKKSGVYVNKGIKLSITDIDTSYSFIEIILIKQTEGVKEAFIAKKSRITSTSMVTSIYSLVDAVPISIDEVVNSLAIYKNIGKLTIINNYCYGWDIKEYKENNHQSKVNDIKVNWYSELVPSVISGKKTFSHGEVVALYIRFNYSWGKGKWNVLVGRESSGTEKDSVILNSKTYKEFQIQDTCSLIGDYYIGKEGTFGYWENETEDYPADGDFPSGKVRHFKFPSINWMRDNVYDNTDYGSSTLDRLGIKLSDVDLNNFKDKDGEVPYNYEIGFAKRTVDNSLNIGQSIVVYNNNGTVSTGNKLFSTGGNFNVSISDVTTDITNKSSIRTYPLDILANQLDLTASYFREEVKLTTENDDTVGDLVVTSETNNPLDNGRKYGHLLSDFHRGNNSSKVSSTIKNKINDSYLVLNNTIKKDINNVFSETYYQIDYGESLEDLVDGNSTVVGATKGISSPIAVDTEVTKLITLVKDNKDCYSDFNNQEIGLLDEKVNNYNIYYGKDTFINKVSVVLYGTYRDAARTNLETSSENDEQGVLEGNVFIKSFICETVNNATYLIDDEVKHYPNLDFSLTKLYHVNRRRDIDPNLFNISVNNDYTIVNDIDYSLINNPDNKEFVDSEYVIVRSNSFTDDNFFNIREFDVNSRKQINRSYGKIVNIQGNRDFIYVHTEKSLFKTISSDRAAIDNNDGLLYIKVGDIFEYPLYSIQHTELGELGTIDRNSCSLTKYGYSFIDRDKSRMYLLGSSLEVISDMGVKEEFKRLLDFPLTNSFISTKPVKDKIVYCEFDEVNERLFVKIRTECLVYSFYSKGWTHFLSRDIIPDFMFKSRKSLFSVKDNKVYKHNSVNTYNNWYGINFESLISKPFITFNEQNKTFFSLNGLSFTPDLFDKVRLYNSFQDSENIQLVPVEQSKTIQENNQANVRFFKGFWLFYYVRDSTTKDKLVDTHLVIELSTKSNSKKRLSNLLIQ